MQAHHLNWTQMSHLITSCYDDALSWRLLSLAGGDIYLRYLRIKMFHANRCYSRSASQKAAREAGMMV